MFLSKINAFLRYGFAVAWSRKLNFITGNMTRFMSVIMFFFLDRLLTNAGAGDIEGGSYFVFLLIGGGFTGFLTRGMRAIAEDLREQMLVGTIEPMIATATPTLWMLIGPSSWKLIESTVQVLLQFGVGALLGADFSRANWLSVLVITLLSLVCISAIGILGAAFTIVYKRSDPIDFLTNNIINLFSGVLFPISVLPPAMLAISYALPFTYAIRSLRGALVRGDTLIALQVDIAALIGFSIVLFPLALWALRRAVRRLKRTGELAHY